MLIVAFLDDSPTIVQFASNDPAEFAAATELVYRLGRFFSLLVNALCEFIGVMGFLSKLKYGNISCALHFF